MTYLAPILMEQMILGNGGWKKWLEYNPAQRTRICTLAEGNSM